MSENKAEETKRPFKLTEEELTNPKLRKGWPGQMMISYPNHYDKEREAPHKNYQPWLSSYFRAGKYVAIRDGLMRTLNGTLPKSKKRVAQET